MLKPLKYITQYKFALTVGLFSLWMLFVDDNSALFIHKQYNELKDLKGQIIKLTNKNLAIGFILITFSSDKNSLKYLKTLK